MDVFIVLESNYTQYGDPKPRWLLDRLQQGYLHEFHSQILYLILEHFPSGGKKDGWIADQYAKTYTSEQGITHLDGLKRDDLFIYTDADEIPSQIAIDFLAMHDGYPEPFGFALRWSVYGFFWRRYDLTSLLAGCTVQFLTKAIQSDIHSIRSGKFRNKFSKSVAEYVDNGGSVNKWILGDSIVYAGWHCSWCLSPERIRVKLTSAINADFPRWGDYPEKLDLNYIKSLVKSGMWFDDTTRIGMLVRQVEDPMYAPQYILQNANTYNKLLDLNTV